MKTYKELMIGIEQEFTEKVQSYIENKKMKTLADTPEFINGLLLGLEVGTELLYDGLKDKPFVNPNQLDFFEIVR